MAQHNDIPMADLKSFPFFTREDQTTPIEHIRDVASLCGVHHITQEDVAGRLLATSFKGRELQWFRSLGVGSVAIWDKLGDKLHR